jgi:hypothetical protein
MTTIGSAVKQGFKLARHGQAAVWVLFLVNLGLAALAALPIYQGILDFTGHSLMADTLTRSFSLDWLTDFNYKHPYAHVNYGYIILGVGLLSLVANSILAGGAVAAFETANGFGYSLGDFFRNAVRYAGRLLRLLFLGLISYWIVFWVINEWLDGRVSKWVRNSMDDRTAFGAHLAVGILLLLGLVVVHLVMDYARVNLMMNDESSAFLAFLSSIGFCLARLRKAFGAYIVPTLCGLAVMAAFLWLTSLRPVQAVASWIGRTRHPSLTIVALFIAQQVVMFLRTWFRVASWGSEWACYGGNR